MATQVATTTAPQSDKVIPLLHIRHHHFAHEEQVKNSDQGNDFVIKERRARKNERRARKNPLPASDLAKVPVDSSASLKQQIASIQQKLNEMSSEEKTKFLAQIQANLSRVQESLVQFAKAVSGKAHVGTSAGEEPKFDAWNSSILMEYTTFAKTEMDQNNKIMVGWSDQQKAQNLILQDAAAEEKKNADKAATQKSPDGLMVGLFTALAVFVVAAVVIALAVFCPPVAAVLAGAGAAAAAGLGFGAVAGLAVGFGTYYGTKNNIENAPNYMVDKTPDSTLLTQLSMHNQFYSAISQAANNLINSGSQTNVVNASSNDTTLGQQASQVIQAMRQLLSIQLK